MIAPRVRPVPAPDELAAIIAAIAAYAEVAGAKPEPKASRWKESARTYFGGDIRAGRER